MNDRKDPILYIVIPCYNEQEVLPITAPLFLQKINDLGAQINDLALRAPFLPEDIATLDRAGLILWYIKYAAEADK